METIIFSGILFVIYTYIFGSITYDQFELSDTSQVKRTSAVVNSENEVAPLPAFEKRSDARINRIETFRVTTTEKSKELDILNNLHNLKYQELKKIIKNFDVKVSNYKKKTLIEALQTYRIQ